MLILTRRINEVLNIGDNVKVKILQVNGNQVRIGIDAPRNVPVNREEIHLRKKKGMKLKEPKTYGNFPDDEYVSEDYQYNR